MLVDILWYLAQQGQFYVDPSSEPCAQVGGAGEDVAEPLVPHELPASVLDQTLHLEGRQTEPFIHTTISGTFDGCSFCVNKAKG